MPVKNDLGWCCIQPHQVNPHCMYDNIFLNQESCAAEALNWSMSPVRFHGRGMKRDFLGIANVTGLGGTRKVSIAEIMLAGYKLISDEENGLRCLHGELSNYLEVLQQA